MILLSSPLKNDLLETTVSVFFFLEIEIFTTKIVNSKSLKKICRQLLSTMNILKSLSSWQIWSVSYWLGIADLFRQMVQGDSSDLCPDTPIGLGKYTARRGH